MRNEIIVGIRGEIFQTEKWRSTVVYILPRDKSLFRIRFLSTLICIKYLSFSVWIMEQCVKFVTLCHMIAV